jgi:hypothetical protein
MSATKLNTPINCAELDDIAHINAFVDSLSDDDIVRIVGNDANRAPITPFKPIR